MNEKKIEQFAEYIEKFLNEDAQSRTIDLDTVEVRKLLLLARRLKGSLPVDQRKMASFYSKLREQLASGSAKVSFYKRFSAGIFHFFEVFRMARMAPVGMMLILLVFVGILAYPRLFSKSFLIDGNPSLEGPLENSLQNRPSVFSKENSSSEKQPMVSDESSNIESGNADHLRSLIADLSESDLNLLNNEEEMSSVSSRFEGINLGELENFLVDDSSENNSLTQELLDLSTSIRDFDPSSQDREFQEMGNDNSLT